MGVPFDPSILLNETNEHADILFARMALYFKGLNLECSAFLPLGPFRRAVRL